MCNVPFTNDHRWPDGTQRSTGAVAAYYSVPTLNTGRCHCRCDTGNIRRAPISWRWGGGFRFVFNRSKCSLNLMTAVTVTMTRFVVTRVRRTVAIVCQLVYCWQWRVNGLPTISQHASSKIEIFKYIRFQTIRLPKHEWSMIVITIIIIIIRLYCLHIRRDRHCDTVFRCSIECSKREVINFWIDRSLHYDVRVLRVYILYDEIFLQVPFEMGNIIVYFNICSYEIYIVNRMNQNYASKRISFLRFQTTKELYYFT